MLHNVFQAKQVEIRTYRSNTQIVSKLQQHGKADIRYYLLLLE